MTAPTLPALVKAEEADEAEDDPVDPAAVLPPCVAVAVAVGDEPVYT